MNSLPYLAGNFDRAGEVDVTLGHDHLHPWMLDVGGLVDHDALVGLVDGVLLGQAHGRHDLVTLGVDQRDLLTLVEAVGQGPVGGEGDRDRPEQAIRGLHGIADPLPVEARHEAVERGETTDTEHDQVAHFA